MIQSKHIHALIAKDSIYPLFQLCLSKTNLSFERSQTDYQLLVCRNGSSNNNIISHFYVCHSVSNSAMKMYCDKDDSLAENIGYIIEDGIATIYIKGIYSNEVIDVYIITNNMDRIKLIPIHSVEIDFNKASYNDIKKFQSDVLTLGSSITSFSINLLQYSNSSKHIINIQTATTGNSNIRSNITIAIVNGSIKASWDNSSGSSQSVYTTSLDTSEGTLTLTTVDTTYDKIVSYQQYVK